MILSRIPEVKVYTMLVPKVVGLVQRKSINKIHVRKKSRAELTLVWLVQVQRADVVLFEGLGEGTETLKFEVDTPTPELYRLPKFLHFEIFEYRFV